jgi:NAD(P)H-flavin reductase
MSTKETSRTTGASSLLSLQKPPPPLPEFIVKVEGPLGAPSQGYSNYPIVVLIAAGIGVTPMISILRELLVKPGKMKRVFFYWTVRDRESLQWFSALLQDIYDVAYDDKEQAPIMHIRSFLTTTTTTTTTSSAVVRNDDDDNDSNNNNKGKGNNNIIGDVLWQHAKNVKHQKNNFCLILGQYSHHQVHVGRRPHWETELTFVKNQAKEQLGGQRKCGVFLCGPDAMAKDVSKTCCRLSKPKNNNDDDVFHFYFSKETF